jgi:hypothetical protein
LEAEAEFATKKAIKATKDLMESAENLIASMQTIALAQNPCTSFQLFDKLRQVLGSGDVGKLQDYIEGLENDGEN